MTFQMGYQVIGELKSLTDLKLGWCELTGPMNELGELQKLEVLNIRHIIFSSGLPDVVGKLGSLAKLHLLSCCLTDLPSSMGALKELKLLELDSTRFTKGCPNVIAKLTSLTNLSMNDCGLESLPSRLGDLQQLEILHLERNNFSSDLPDVFEGLCSLTELNLQDCHLTKLPPSIGELKQLKILHLERNNLTGGFLPSSIGDLQQLEVLHLERNNFSSGLPDVFEGLCSLTELNLQDCHLTKLPPSMGELKQLKILHLERNNLTGGFLPSRFGNLQQLDELFLDSNDLSSGLPDVIVELGSLTKLYLCDCSLTNLPPRFGELQRLKLLFIEKGNFSSGCLDVIGELSSLTELHLQECSLKDCPPSWNNLQRLRELDLGKNWFKRIPSVIYKLEELKSLDLHGNLTLMEMDNRILQLKDFQKIGLDPWYLRAPLGALARKGGLEMIKKFFIDLEKKAVVSTIPVAIIGEAQAGKTCIRKSLISQKRETIDRFSPSENATEVFEVETLKLETSEVNLIDFGGQDIYHVAYQLALKEACVPLVVVNMARYKGLIEEVRSEEEATKRLCMEWLCHLYVAQPTLGRPMLALTHIDELSSREEFEELKGALLQKAEDIQGKWLKREEQFSGTVQNSESSGERISYIEKLKFSDEDIFEFTNENESSDIKALMARVESRCVGEIPQNWNDVGDFLKPLEKPYIRVFDVAMKFPDCRDILQYLHTTGTILWFDQKQGLSEYVFHRTEAVTNMVALLFPLDKGKMKTECIVSFSEFFHNRQPIGIEAYKQFLDNYLYNTTGMIDEALLCNRVETKTDFEFPIAIELLKCFRIAHGPIELKDDSSPRTVYLVPSFIEKSLDKSWETSGRLQLRFDLIFNGLPLPEHVYQLMTVEVLNLKMGDEPVEAYSNGAEVQHDENCTTCLVHDYAKQKVTIQVSKRVGSLKDSWDRLKKATKALKSLLKEEWPACLVELKTYCAHCLFLQDPLPGSLPNPAWYTDNKTFSGLKLVKCLKSDAKNLTVPKPFLVPCSNLDCKEIAELEGYLTKWQSQALDAGMRQEVPYTQEP